MLFKKKKFECVFNFCSLILLGVLWFGDLAPVSAAQWERVCRASWKYELTKGRERLPSTSLCPCTSEKACVKILPSVYLSLRIYSMLFYLHHSIFLPSFLSFSLRPLAQQLILHAQEQTEISIRVMPHSLATPTNGSMQLGCTHSKRPFEYSSANSCIHWYLKCSGSARALNPWYIWQNPPQKRRKKNKDGYRGQGSRQFLLCGGIKY